MPLMNETEKNEVKPVAVTPAVKVPEYTVDPLIKALLVHCDINDPYAGWDGN